MAQIRAAEEEAFSCFVAQKQQKWFHTVPQKQGKVGSENNPYINGGKGDTLAQKASSLPHQMVRRKLTWVWWVSGSLRRQGSGVMMSVFMPCLGEGTRRIDGPTHTQEDCKESDLGTLKLFAWFTVLYLQGFWLGTRPRIFIFNVCKKSASTAQMRANFLFSLAVGQPSSKAATAAARHLNITSPKLVGLAYLCHSSAR
eukprot:1140377-Pelagomonas_calceolata.AAC.2